MWVAIVYMCLSAECFFIDSPPALTEEGCLEMLAGATRQLATEPSVIAFDGECIRIQIKEG